MKWHGTKFRRKGSVGIVTVHPSNNENSTNYDPRSVADAIREKVRCDDSIKLLFITGEGDRAALLREILEMNEEVASARLRRMK